MNSYKKDPISQIDLINTDIPTTSIYLDNTNTTIPTSNHSPESPETKASEAISDLLINVESANTSDIGLTLKKNALNDSPAQKGNKKATKKPTNSKPLAKQSNPLDNNKVNQQSKPNSSCNSESQVYDNYVQKIRANLNKDLHLKLLTRRLLESAGFFTALETNIYKPSYLKSFKHEQVSDIDVLGIRFDIDLRNTMVVVECKSGEDHSLDELLKLKGMMDYLNANYGYLVKTTISNNARELGSGLKISTFSHPEIAQLILSQENFNGGLPKWLETETDNYIHEKALLECASGLFPQTVKYLSRDLWNNPDHTNIHNICVLLSKYQGTDVLHRREVRYLFLQLVINISIFILKHCAYALAKSLSNATECLLELSFGGPKEKREREILFDKVNQLLAAEGKQPSNFIPDYTNSIIDLSLMFLKTPSAAKDVPRCLDYYCKASIVSYKGLDINDINIHFSNITLKLTKDILIMATKLGGQNTSVFNDLLNK